MPTRSTAAKARKKLKEGKSPSTAAGEFVHEEIEHVREGKHGARSTKQAIAIGLSKARQAGIPVKPKKKAGSKKASSTSGSTSQKSSSKSSSGTRKAPSKKRSAASTRALKQESTKTTSKKALSRQAKSTQRRKAAAK